MKITKAVIPAAGLGTRVLPATKSMPKEMLPIVDKPTIQNICYSGCNCLFNDILNGRFVYDREHFLWH